jgi:hypothetical protein
MNILKPTPLVPMSVFTSHEGILCADMSDLGHMPLGRVYDDACDVGFTLITAGREVVYVERTSRRDSEGDLLWTEFTPADRRDRSHSPDLRLYND